MEISNINLYYVFTEVNYVNKSKIFSQIKQRQNKNI